MEIYERIMNRRKELGLSADKVAEALGVSRSTIYRYESAYIEKVPLHVLGPLATVLQTTPEYLMGWDPDDPFNKRIVKTSSSSESSGDSSDELSDEARAIGRAYDLADDGTKNSVAKLLDVKREGMTEVEDSYSISSQAG